MDVIKLHDTGAAVEDVQQRLVLAGCLAADDVDGVFGDKTLDAVHAFCQKTGIPVEDEVSQKVWSTLVDASFLLGNRTLYLRMPYFHGHDVLELQNALSALGFSCGQIDGMFGAYTEQALRKFQMNLGLPADGIAGAYTYAAIHNLQHSWEGKAGLSSSTYLGFARASNVLETNALCLFGTGEFTRSVAARMSNLAIATNPASKMVSADSLLVAPDADMLMVRIALPEEVVAGMPIVMFEHQRSLPVRMRSAIEAARRLKVARIVIQLPGKVWEDAGEDRSAQHYAITLLDALCSALSEDGVS